jgi:hypothetical protein
MVVGQNTNAANIVCNRELNARFQLLDGKGRVQQRMIDHFGNVEILVGRHIEELSAGKSGQRREAQQRQSLTVILVFF